MTILSLASCCKELSKVATVQWCDGGWMSFYCFAFTKARDHWEGYARLSMLSQFCNPSKIVMVKNLYPSCWIPNDGTRHTILVWTDGAFVNRLGGAQASGKRLLIIFCLALADLKREVVKSGRHTSSRLGGAQARAGGKQLLLILRLDISFDVRRARYPLYCPSLLSTQPYPSLIAEQERVNLLEFRYCLRSIVSVGKRRGKILIDLQLVVNFTELVVWTQWIDIFVEFLK